jgi:hypothetical protein
MIINVKLKHSLRIKRETSAYIILAFEMLTSLDLFRIPLEVLHVIEWYRDTEF